MNTDMILIDAEEDFFAILVKGIEGIKSGTGGSFGKEGRGKGVGGPSQEIDDDESMGESY